MAEDFCPPPHNQHQFVGVLSYNIITILNDPTHGMAECPDSRWSAALCPGAKSVTGHTLIKHQTHHPAHSPQCFTQIMVIFLTIFVLNLLQEANTDAP